MSDRVLGPGRDCTQASIAQDFVGETDKRKSEELGNSSAIQKLGFEVNLRPHTTISYTNMNIDR